MTGKANCKSTLHSRVTVLFEYDGNVLRFKNGTFQYSCDVLSWKISIFLLRGTKLTKQVILTQPLGNEIKHKQCKLLQWSPLNTL